MVYDTLVNVVSNFFREFQENIKGWDLRSDLLMDVLDVSLVAFVFYQILLMIRGTRILQMSLLVGALIVTYYLSRRFGLITLYTLLDGLMAYLVLLVVIVYQNDIRRVLVQMFRQPFFGSEQKAVEIHATEEVLKAAHMLSAEQIGALVVFERKISLIDLVEPGTTLDAAVSKELLYSIFVPEHQNPLHDGAVLIRDGRILQAGMFLPMAPALADLDKSLGTRHRAGIAISEETDAVVLVVSETRGSISICFNGNLVRDLDESALRETLFSLLKLEHDPTKSDPVKKLKELRNSIPPLFHNETAVEPASENRETDKSL